MAENFISKRACKIYQKEDFLQDRLNECVTNLFHPIENKEGVINFTTALNHLMENEWEERMNREDTLKFSSSRHQHYYNMSGKTSLVVLKEAAASFYNRHFSPEPIIQPTDISVGAGTATCLNSLAFALFDSGDYFLTTSPTYYRTEADLSDKLDVNVIPFHLDDKPNEDGLSFNLNPEGLEKRISEILSDGIPLKVVFVINPNNPLGDVLAPDTINEILKICAKFKLHVIFNEVYAFSVFEPECNFTSVLSLKDIPDPERTHHIWGLSKDLGLAGIRCAFIHSRNRFVSSAIASIELYMNIPEIILDLCGQILNDKSWLDDFFMPLNKKRLHDQHRSAVSMMTKLGVYVRPAPSCVFLWIDLCEYLSESTPEAEIALFWEFFNAGVLLAPGTLFMCSTPGWFRIVFSVPEINLQTGIARIASVLEKKKKTA